MNLLITGAAGQLGKAFVSELKANRDIQFSAYSRGDLDVTCVDEAQTVIARERPDFVINTGAYTQVDLAESEKENAYLVNETGPANLAEVCKRLDIPLVHFSTDYVFDGSKQGPWLEDDPTAPLGIYGASKLAGEKAITQIHSKHLIFRTSWVFSGRGPNKLFISCGYKGFSDNGPFFHEAKLGALHPGRLCVGHFLVFP